MSIFPRIFEALVASGRDLLERRSNGRDPVAALGQSCSALLTQRGEASGLALAGEIMAGYEQLSTTDQGRFVELLAKEFSLRPEKVLAAAELYCERRDYPALAKLRQSLETPLQTLLSRLNMVPGGTGTIIRLRERLLPLLAEREDLRVFEDDLRELLAGWFNGGFLTLRRIDWGSPASVLERIIRYEAVHEISGWDDLRNRLREDRRCFAFFHFAMPDDPLIFVQVALTEGLASAIEPLLAFEREIVDAQAADTAMFYSISNCHKGLQGISFGHLLIKQVVDELRRELENIKCFATLSPIPGFRQWLTTVDPSALPAGAADALTRVRRQLAEAAANEADLMHRLAEEREALLKLCAHYLLEARRDDGQPMDSVARFHLANGASVEQLNWAADRTPAGILRSCGIMVNYVYTPKHIDRNHAEYFASGTIAAASAVKRLLKA